MNSQGTNISATEIVNKLKSLGLSVNNQQDIINSEPDVLQYLFLACSRIVLGQKSQDVSNISARAYKFMSHDTDERAVNHIHTKYTILKAMNLIGINDFTLRDILTPELKKTQRIFQSFFKFIAYKEDQISLFREQIELNKESESRYNQIKIEQEKHREDLEQVKAQKQQEKPEFVEQQSVLKNIAEKISENKLIKDEIADNLYQLQMDEQEMVKAVDKASNEIYLIQNIINELQNQIVPNPDKVNQKSQNLIKDINNESEWINQVQSDLIYLYFQKQSLTELKKVIENKQQNLKAVKLEVDREKMVKQKLKDTRNILQNLRESQDSILKENQILQNTLEDQQNLLEQDIQNDEDNDEFQNKIVSLQNEQVSAENVLATFRSNIEQLEVMKQNLLQQLEQRKNQKTIYMHQTEDFYQNLNLITQNYFEKLEKQLLDIQS